MRDPQTHEAIREMREAIRKRQDERRAERRAEWLGWIDLALFAFGVLTGALVW